MKILEEVKKTIEYAAKFNCPLSLEELEQRLISKKIYSKEEIRKIGASLGLKKNGNKFKLEKIKKAKQIANLMVKKFKNILFIGISGSVAAGYPKKNDDIDIMLITKKDKLWLTRFQLRWYVFSKKIPHRRYGQKEKMNEFCFNLWLDEKSLAVEKSKQNLKNAMDLIMMIPIVNKNHIYERFIQSNKWVKKYLATGYDNLDSRSLMIGCSKEKNNYLDELVNKLFFGLQYWYMRKKIKGEKIGLHKAFFHP